ncbi:reprolysin-like metallopeptidase [Winogradskyella ouciana]|uniref:T9SS type A sorting domain-containing protein n=1 Tax=Winogradskyella ouciana TaxID=2608631 RepID=A0A7K1G9X7_9FLAO|nr:zinc-dependent metalloprotease family protein [Winogradskyella ouciana]MTE26100.1 T9SS type A sorting domain-containing protein [Winogradskyella ouciana]
MKKEILLIIAMVATTMTWSQDNAIWQKESLRSNEVLKESHQSLNNSQSFNLDTDRLRQSLMGVAQRSDNSVSTTTILSFPNSDGKLERFSIKEASVMHPDLQAAYPEIRSYVGQGIDNASSVLRFSLSPYGFSGMILSANGKNTFIEPIGQDTNSYIVFNRKDRVNINNDFECSVTEQVNSVINNGTAFRNADDSILRTYRLAVSATGEYTQFHGGTVSNALAAINTTMTRVNGIFEVDFNVTLTLIANTTNVIYTNSGSDPYGNTTTNYNSELQNTLTSVIGEANYDIGHLFANLQNNGNAGCIGCVCVNNQKGSGWTSATNPVGDFFDVDYVAHEMGHQFGANHTWTHGGNEGTNVQVEPGSGSTIMSYAGITGATDVQANVHPNFHAVSIEQVTDYVKSTSCQTNTNTGNVVPVITALSNYTIPRGTAFILEGSATDADTPSNALTYSWEQMDENNASTTYPSTTATTGVAFRAYEPTSDSFRYFPRLQTIKTGATSWQWEAVPNVARTLNFRLTVRDNVAGGGTNNSDDMVVTVNGTAGPFVVNSPNTNVTWNAGTTQTITWDVAGTTGNGVNAANVDIFLSTDGGDTYPISLATGVTNDGSHNVVIPNNQGNQNRIMVRGSNNIFFDISDTNFTIDAPIPCNPIVPTGLSASNVSFNSATIDWDSNVGATFDIRYREVGTTPYTNITGVTSNAYQLTGLTPTTDYELEIRSVCTASNSVYSTTLLFSTTAIPPCTGALINSFPYEESYDSGIGDWIQASGDDGDWILYNGLANNGTPSGGTGPSDDITGGGNYLYIEASSNNTPGEIGANATAILDSPCFDLSSESNPFLSFYNHMFGGDTGTLTLEVTTDDGSNWITLFTQSGNQGNQWNFVQLDLSAYNGLTVKFRITGLTGNGFESDIAIDHFRIGAPTYCNSNGNNTSDEYISKVTLNNIDNDSGDSATSLGYSDFTSISTNLFIGSSYPISITPFWPGANYDEGYSVWIDFNQDGDFDDSGEQVFTQAPTQDNPVTGNISIPNDALLGPTRMRVSLKYDGIPTQCESFGFGEVEDYTVNMAFDGLLFTNNAWTPNAPDNTTGTDNALVLDGISTITSDVELNDIIIRTGAELQVDSSGSLTLNGNLVSDGMLSLNSVSTNYSSLIVDGTVTGNVRYFRHANNTATVGEGDANDLIAPPVSGQAFNVFASSNSNIVSSNDNTLYLFGPFEKPANTYVLYSNTETATLDAGTGYRAASTNNSTFEFFGTVNTGNINVPIEVSGSTYPEWNLVGNPYPSYISLADFLTANDSQLAVPNVGIYGYDGNASNGWTIWNQAYSLLNPNAKITPGQGFLVASIPGGGTISFTPSMRETGNSDDFIAGRNNPSSISYFKLNLTSESNSYHTEFYVSDDASLSLDPGYDARTFGSIAPDFSIYSQLVEDNDGTDMAIQAISNLDIANDAIVPIGINAVAGQQLTISLSDYSFPEEIDIYLEDRQNNSFTLLNDTDFILSDASDLQGIGRFFLRFNQSVLNVDDSSLETIQIISLANPKQIVVKGQLDELTELTIFDVRGREILNQDLPVGSLSNTISTSGFVSGVYLVQLKDTKNKISKKLIVR